MNRKIPLYTTVRNGIFYFQLWVTTTPSPFMLKYSLNTRSRQIAYRKMSLLYPIIELLKSTKAQRNQWVMEISAMISMKLSKVNDALSEHSLEQNHILELINYGDYDSDDFEIDPENIEHLKILSDTLKSFINNPIKVNKEREDSVYNIYKKIHELDGIADSDKYNLLDMLRFIFNVDIDIQRLFIAMVECNYNEEDQIRLKLKRQKTELELALKNALESEKKVSIEEQPTILCDEIQQKKASHTNGISLSTLWNEHKAAKEINYKKDNKGELNKNNLQVLRRQEKYFKKFIAVAGDFDITQAKRMFIFDKLCQLFNWPDERTSGKYNAIRNAKNYQDNEWYEYIAENLEDIAEDESIKKSTGVVKEVKKWLDEIFKYAEEREYINESPTKKPTTEFTRAIKRNKLIRGAFTNKEVEKILSYLQQNPSNLLYWPIVLMAYTGARNSELYRITKSDINFSTGHIFINGTKSKASKRYLPISSKLINKWNIKQYVETFKSDETLLSRAVPEGRINSDFLELCSTLGIDSEVTNLHKESEYRGFYSLRKSFRTYLIGQDKELVEIMMGHSTKGSAVEEAYKNPSILTEYMPKFQPIIDSLPW